MNNGKFEESSAQEIQRIFNLQKQNQYRCGNSTLKERKAKLKSLHHAVIDHRNEIREALYKDFAKHPAEVDLSEIFAVTSEIKHALRKLPKWLGRNKRKTPLVYLGASSRVKYEPKGVVLIVAPWNFPVNLSLGPLVSAIAAGNCVVVKPSEITPNTSLILKKIVSEVFDESEVAVIQGGVETSKLLLEQAFNHIFFTGSPAVGKAVMAAASKHLSSVTLELGGKSPTIVDETANLKQAARRIAWSKYLNNGQMCIATDYILVHKSVKNAFILELKKTVFEFYGSEPEKESSYNRIVSAKHLNRLKGLLGDLKNKGGEIIVGGKVNEEGNYISPTIISDVPLDSMLMQEEIFGPILPISTYQNLEDAIEIINAKEKPLALYIYSKSKQNTRWIIANTRAGGTVINQSLIHFYNPNLGFGGVNNSGIGRGHGDEGFKAFSNPRGIMKQHIPNAIDLLVPPYTNFKRKLIKSAIKWF